MSQSSDEWWNEYERLRRELERYHFLIPPDLTYGDRWVNLEFPKKTFVEMFGYWEVAIVNQGELFRHVGYICANEAYFAAIGAVGQLKAAKALSTHFLEYERLGEIDVQLRFRQSIEPEIEVAVSFVEGVNEFASLLLQYVRANLPEPPSGRA